MIEEKVLNVKTEDSSEIRFVINTYGDIFSDFDPRSFSQKGLSADFLSAAKGATVDKPANKVDFIFLVPGKERNVKDEVIIKERLKKHFKKHLDLLEKERGKMLKQGSYFTVMGIILMIFATFLLFKFKNRTLLASFFTVLLEPAGWFLFWEGMHQIVFDSKKSYPNLDFYRKMVGVNIKFSSI